MLKQGEPKSFFTPWTTDSQCADPTNPLAVAVLRKSRNLIVIPGNHPQGWVKIGIAKFSVRPVFIVAVVAAPMITEDFIVRLPDGNCMLIFDEWSQLNAGREDYGRRSFL